MDLIPPLPPELLQNSQTQIQQQPQQTGEVVRFSEWSREKLDLLKRTIAKDLTDDEFSLFTEICKRRKLDPFAKQIYPVKRKGNMVVQTAIDGYRLIADRSGRYAGQTGPYWCGTDGIWKDIWTQATTPPYAAKVGVLKHGFLEPVWGVAYWTMYYTNMGGFWDKGGPHMLAKVAEALALKKAFPEELSGIYTTEEMQQADTTFESVPVAQDGDQEPEVVFLDKIVNQWSVESVSGSIKLCLALDTSGNEWLFSDKDFPYVDSAVAGGTPLVCAYKLQMGRRVVTGVQQ